MIWFFLALIIVTVIVLCVFRKNGTDNTAAQIHENSVRIDNSFNNRKISDSIVSYSVSSLLSMIEKAKKDAAVHDGTFTLDPEVEQRLREKIAQEEKTARRDEKLANAICLAYDDASYFGQTEEMASLDPGLQNRAKLHLDTLRALAKETRQRAKALLREEAQYRDTANMQVKRELLLPDRFQEIELYELMQFIGFQVEGCDLVEPLGVGRVLVWRHRRLLDLYLSLIEEECRPDGIAVSYAVQIQDGWNALPYAVTLPYRLEKEPKHQIVSKVVLCFSCSS